MVLLDYSATRRDSRGNNVYRDFVGYNETATLLQS